MPRDPSACSFSHGGGAYNRPPPVVTTGTQSRRRSRDRTAVASDPHHPNGNGTATLVHPRFESSRAFFEKLDELLDTAATAGTLEELDQVLLQFVRLCGLCHDDWLRDPDDISRALNLLLDSDLFQFNDQRMVGIMMFQALDNTNPHELYIWYYLILHYGLRSPSLFRSHRKWSKLLPTLMETVEVVPLDEGWVDGLPPIEHRLHLPATQLLYEVCRVMRLTDRELDLFSDQFIDHLFDVVEQSRSDRDDVLSQAVVKLILALNEQFMVWSLPKHQKREPERGRCVSSSNLVAEKDNSPVKPAHFNRPRSQSVAPVTLASAQGRGDAAACDEGAVEETKRHNRVLVVLMRRLGSSKAFGEVMCFMLNRAEDIETPEGLGAQLIILKMLYLLFTTPGTQEYFYSNDLRVVIDVFIRMLIDLPDELDQLRHTMLRVLYPLLCNSQMRADPYKRNQLCLVLHSLVANEHIRDVDPTTKRLVERCLGAAKDPGDKESPKTHKGGLRSSSDPVASPRAQRPPAKYLSPESAASLSLGPLADALPGRKGAPVYTDGNPVRVTSLIDVSSGALERPPSAASTCVDSPTDRSANSTPLPLPKGGSAHPRRRKAPAPPAKRKHSGASTASITSAPSDDDGIPTQPPSLVDAGAGGVPPPIIEVRPNWVTFTA